MRKRHRSIEQLKKSTAWGRGLDLVLEIYRVTRPFPREELFNLSLQLRKAAVRIPSCIAKGRERDTGADRRHFLTTARGSLAEIETQLVTARLLGYLSETDLDSVLEITDHLSAMLTKLRRNIKPRPP
ncbi:MAG TPA: four helix bundle protein [Gemmatimonadaceae bacterium]|nr:four helix bundle protein [Gemmatimonadaceae bacterium]